MPEGPEIRIQADEITPHTVGKTLTSIDVQSGRYMRHPETWEMPLQLPLQVDGVFTSGKLLVWSLQGMNFIFCRAAMSGRWTLREEKHNHIKFSFSDGTAVYFNDARNFGSVKFGNHIDMADGWTQLGIDALQEDVTFQKIQGRINYKQPIGKILLDQSIFNGVGNYLRSEALYAARINPFRRAGSLSIEEWDRLCKEITDISRLSYNNGGATIRSYKNLNGDRGSFADRFHVYGRKTDPENRKVTRMVDESKRAVWFVDEIQI